MNSTFIWTDFNNIDTSSVHGVYRRTCPAMRGLRQLLYYYANREWMRLQVKLPEELRPRKISWIRWTFICFRYRCHVAFQRIKRVLTGRKDDGQDKTFI